MSFYPCLPNLPSFKKFNVFQPPRQLTETLEKQDDIPGSYLLWMIRKQGMNPTCVQLVCGENTWQPWPANSLFYCNGFGIPEGTTSKLVGDDQNVTTPTPPKFDIDTDQMLQMLKGNTFYDGARCFCWAVTLQISEVTNHKKGPPFPTPFFFWLGWQEWIARTESGKYQIQKCILAIVKMVRSGLPQLPFFSIS